MCRRRRAQKQTIRFYCFLACEEIRAAAGYSAASTAADAATAATAANATSIAAGRKQQAGGSRKAEEAATANKGVARPVKMSNYFAKMLQNSRERGSGKKQIQKQIESPYSSSYTKKRNDK